MKKPVFFKAFSLFMAFTLIFSGFAGIQRAKAADVVTVTGVTLTKQTDTIDIGGATKLLATVEPINATNKDVEWVTDNPAIARVTDGLVRGYGEGTTIIRVITKDQGKTAYCVVTVKKPVLTTPIANVKADDDNNGIPDFIIMTTPFVLEGRISADFRALVNNVLTGTVYLQDTTAGIGINGITRELTLGSKVRVTGNVVYNNGETQFNAANVEIVDTSVEAVAPVTATTKDSMLEKNEGLLVKIQGKITKTSEGTIYVNDTTTVENEAKIIIGNYFTIITVPTEPATTQPTTTTTPATTTTTVPATTTPAGLKIGDTVSVTGINSQDAAGHKLVIRNSNDITVVTNPDNATDTKKTSVRLNKSSIVIKSGKFEHINILTTPGNAVITSVKIKTAAPIVTLSQDKKNKRLLTITPSKTAKATSQKLEIEVVVDGKTYTLTLDVKIDTAKAKVNNKKK